VTFFLSLTQQFIIKLLQESEARIRTNAIHSVNHLRSLRKWQFYQVIRPMLFENNPRVQIEAARYIWEVDVAEQLYIVCSGSFQRKTAEK